MFCSCGLIIKHSCGRNIEYFGLICSLQTLNEALASGDKEQSKAALEKQVRNRKRSNYLFINCEILFQCKRTVFYLNIL